VPVPHEQHHGHADHRRKLINPPLRAVPDQAVSSRSPVPRTANSAARYGPLPATPPSAAERTFRSRALICRGSAIRPKLCLAILSV
jgi:hypothetical protein